jgi:hypothetical protein
MITLLIGTTKVFFPHIMTTISSFELNERACFLLSQGSVSEGLALFKKALSALKREIKDRAMDLPVADTPQKPLCENKEATAGPTGACFCWLIPAPMACKEELSRFWIYSRPLSMQRVTNGSACVMWSNHSNAFTISFNVGLASHLRGVEQAMEGDNGAATHSFQVAMKLYKLALCQCQENYQDSSASFNTLNDHVYAAIFSNLAHVHAMLGEIRESTAFANQLLKTLFYLVDSGRVSTVLEATTHKLLLENAHCILMASSNSAAAA